MSYQIGKLETDLGFKLFDRNQQRISLTEKGKKLWHVSQTALSQIDQEIALLRDEQSRIYEDTQRNLSLSIISQVDTGIVREASGVLLFKVPIVPTSILSTDKNSNQQIHFAFKGTR